MGGFAPIARAFGDLGSQAGQGYDIAQQWQQQRQQMAMAQARQKMSDMMLPYQIQEIQQRIRQANLPRAEGTATLPGGGVGGVTFDPANGKYGVQTLQGGIGPDAVKRQITSMSANLLPKDKAVLDSLTGELDMGADPLKVLDKAQAFFSSVSKATQKGVQIKTDAGGIPVEVIDANGNSYSAFDPQLPPELKQQVDAYNNAVKQQQTWKIDDEQRRANLEFRRFQAALNPQMQKQFQADAMKASLDARNAYVAMQRAQQDVTHLSDATSQDLVGLADKITGGSVHSASYRNRIGTWGLGHFLKTLPKDDAQAMADEIKAAYDQKRQAAADAWSLGYPNQPLPPWLRDQGASAGDSGADAMPQGTPPPPPIPGAIVRQTQ